MVADMMHVVTHDPAVMLRIEEQLRCFLDGGTPESEVITAVRGEP